MRTLRTLVIFLALFAFSNNELFSQINPPSLKTIFSLDSIAGFDEDAEKNIAISKGLYGMEFNAYMNQQKRIFVNNKYKLPFFDYEANYVANYSSKKYSGATINNAPCVNEDFEANSFNGWTISQGTTNAIASGTLVYGACIDNPCPTSISTGSLASIVTTPLLDPVINVTIPNSPFGGTKVAKLNTNTTFLGGNFIFKAIKITQNFPVTVNNSLFDFAYYAVMDASSPHQCCEQPYMYVKMRDCFGNLLTSCPVFSITVPGTGCAGTGPTSWTTTSGISRSNGWQQYSIDLATYIGCNITIEVTVGHCQFGGHFAYAYFDSRCNQMDFTVNGNTVNAPSTSPVNATVACASTATLTAPSGLGPYLWNGPVGSGITSNTNQVITTNVAGSYSISMSPVGICNPINRIISLTFPPPTTITVSQPNLCSSGTNTSSTLSASGASQYTWAPGGSTLSTIVVTPTITTIYTLTARTGTCLGTFTTQVTVNPDPSISILSSNTSLCPGQSATLTAFGANSYVWNPGGLTGSLVTVTQAVATTYTVVGTSTAGCTGSSTVFINQTIAPPVSIIASPAITGPICRGSSVNLIGIGAPSFTWLPDNVTGIFQTFTPTITTTYTAIGASGSCTNSALFTVTVDPGPPITITPNPTLVCPGNSTTLTAVSPSAVGAFTWQPGGSNAASIVVTPTISGGYSVSAVNALGCRNTETINPNISPLPNISISPASPSICLGNSVTLNASGGVSYTWQPGNLNGTSISVSPLVNTTYTLTGANTAGCLNQTVTTVTTFSNPVIFASVSPTAVCAGSCATITPGGALTYTIQGGSFVVCPLATTSFSIIGANAAGCISAPIVVPVTVNNAPSLSASASPTAICPGGSSNLTAFGALNYTWQPGNLTGASVSVTPAVTTVYTVTGVNASGCTNTVTTTVVVNSVPNVSVSPSSTNICEGNSVTLTASGASTYTWQPGNLTGSSIVVSPTLTTTYTVTGSNGTCSNQNTAVVNVLPKPVITSALYNPQPLCAGSCATLNVIGVSTFTVSGLSAVACPTITSTYTVIGSDVFGCISNPFTGVLTVISAPNVSATASPTSICPGGSSNLTASGALNYTWQPGNLNGASVSVTPAITTVYTVTGVNATGCTNTITTTVVVNSVPNVSISPSFTSICPGNTVTLIAIGASTYTWQPGNLTGSSIVVSPTLTTTYTVTGSNGACTGQNTAVVNVLPKPVITSALYSPQPLCAGSCATLSATGVSNFTVSGLTPIACPTITSTYTVIGSNPFSCPSDPFTGTLTVISAPSVSASASPTSICPGGSSNLTASGALTYTWQPVNLTGTSISVNPTITTIYTVTGTNASGCTRSATVSVTVLPVPSISATASPSSICSGASSTLTASGAGNYFWTPGGLSGPNVFVAPNVSTTFTVTGNTGACSASTTVFVLVNATPSVNITASSLSVCAGGSVTLGLSGATTYSWSDGSTAAPRVVTPSVTTTYVVTGFGVTGCTSLPTAITITVNTIPNITANASPSNICIGGTIALTAFGANTYTWFPGSSTGSLFIVSPTTSGNYLVNGTSVQGCTSSATVAVAVSPSINLGASASPSTICAGGLVTLTGSGAANYTWLPGPLPSSPVVTVSPSASTIYTLIGSNGACSSQTTVIVNVTSPPSVSISASSSSVCAGNCATLTASGAISYAWSNGTSGPSTIVCPSLTTTYSVAGTTSGCTGQAQITIIVNTPPSLTISANPNPICSGSTANLTAFGASNYTWSTGSNLSSITVAPATTSVYTVIGSNGAGCAGSTSVTLNVTPLPIISISSPSTTICSGFTTALIAFVSGPIASVTWQPGGSTNNPLIVSPLSTTVYSATANNGGCSATATINITVNSLPNVSLTANPQTICAGETTTLTASGAATYTWIPSLTGGSTFTDNPTVTTSYTVVGISANGCPNFATTLVNVVPAPNVLASSNVAVICSGGSVSLMATGATNYTWFPGSLTGSMVVVNPTGTTVYTVVGDNGGTCTGSSTIVIGVNPLPPIIASASNASICPAESVTLTAFGGVNYTWTPPGLNGASIVDFPTISTNYTVVGEDANGCTNTANVFVFVNPLANITAVASPSNICRGGTSTLTGSGGLSYTWNPGAQTTNPLIVSPLNTEIYTLTASDISGCTGNFTVVVNVIPTPTIIVSPANPSICIGSSATLTATGANNYTWLPSGSNSSVVIETPVVLTTYTVTGDNAGICFSSTTVDVFVNPLPANVTAASIGTVGCVSPTAALFGLSSDINVSYSWQGPQGYSSSLQNPIVSGIWGTFTLNVTDNVTGCIASATVDVPTDNTIPLVTAVTSGSITCAVSTVTLNAINTTTNPAYAWSGPGSFTSTIQSPTANLAGTYTVVVRDLSSGCSDTAAVTVGTRTNVLVTASITPATCTGGNSNNDGRISVANFTITDKYDLVSGSTYTGSATYATAANIPTNGVITSNLSNPSTTVAYTIRLFDNGGCIKDTVLILIPVDCSLRTLGIAKAVSPPELNTDGSYNLTYTVVAKNYDLGTLNGISLTENLSATFPAPTTFTVIVDSLKTISGTPLSLNSSFDGSTQTNLLTSSTSNSLVSKDSTVIQFKIRVKIGIFFVPFRNTVVGQATNLENKVIIDSSHVGLNPDPDNDKNPYNNNIPTAISFSPNVFFGITKVGEINKSDNESYDVTYTITVHNLGNDTVREVTLKDSLFGKTIQNPATFSMRFAPVSSGGGLVANSAYNGNTNIDLVIPSESKIAPGTTSSVYFTINVVPGTITSISNSAYGNAQSAVSATESILVSDTSNSGFNPDVNGNGIWNEPADNVPTLLLIPNTSTLFIPEGFSPNGDNTNDVFVIRGLPVNGNNPITIFNRWGNKVYSNSNYDNSWDGTPNVSGTLGKDKLPPGTYYYIIELKGTGLKPITGFVVLQY